MWIDLATNDEDSLAWTQHASNEQILRMGDESRSLMEILSKREKNWIGHVLRQNLLFITELVIEGRFQGKKPPGRPRTMLFYALMQEDEESVID